MNGCGHLFKKKVFTWKVLFVDEVCKSTGVHGPAGGEVGVAANLAGQVVLRLAVPRQVDCPWSYMDVH